MKNNKSNYLKAVKLYKENIYTTKEISAALNINHSTFIKWIQADETYRLLNKKKTKLIKTPEFTNRQSGFSCWVNMIIKNEVNRKKQIKNHSTNIKKAS